MRIWAAPRHVSGIFVGLRYGGVLIASSDLSLSIPAENLSKLNSRENVSLQGFEDAIMVVLTSIINVSHRWFSYQTI